MDSMAGESSSANDINELLEVDPCTGVLEVAILWVEGVLGGVTSFASGAGGLELLSLASGGHCFCP